MLQIMWRHGAAKWHHPVVDLLLLVAQLWLPAVHMPVGRHDLRRSSRYALGSCAMLRLPLVTPPRFVSSIEELDTSLRRQFGAPRV